MNYVIGVDGGGTKARLILADENGNKISYTETSGVNQNSAGGLEQVVARIQEGMNRLMEQAPQGITFDAVRVIALGLAGMGSEADKKTFLSYFKMAKDKEVILTEDTHLVLAMCPNQIGVGLICGNGSNCIGRSESGQIGQVGGHGPLFDEGGGNWLAHRTLELASKISDGRFATPTSKEFSRAILYAAKADNFSNLYKALYREGPEARNLLYGAVCPALMEQAVAGNPEALGILRQGATELALHVKALAAKLDLTEPVLSYCGSVLVLNEVYQKMLWDELAAQGVFISEKNKVTEPVQGALALALERLHLLQ